MTWSKIEFRTKTASLESINWHLRKCVDCFNPFLSINVDLEEYSKKIFNNAITFEAWHGLELVGLIAAYFNNLETRLGYITHVGVLEEYQRAGVASELLMKTKSYGKDNGFTRIDLEVRTNNPEAIKLYKKHGFIIAEQNNTSLKMAFNLSANSSGKNN